MLEMLLSFMIVHHPIRVLIIDTGSANIPSISSNTPIFQQWSVSHEHGTTIAYLVINGTGPDAKKISKDTIVEICDVGYNEHSKSDTNYSNCLFKMASGNYDFVNISLSGPTYFEIEETAIRLASFNSKIIVAAGNDKLNLDKVKAYPASYKDGGYVRAISSLDDKGLMMRSSNYGKGLPLFKGIATAKTVGDFYTTTQGTSIAAALYTHELILK